MDEAVFFHEASRSLILTDLIQNNEPDKIECCFLHLLMKLAGSLDPAGSTPRDLRLNLGGSRRETRDAVHQMIEWRPDQVIFSHGKCYQKNAMDELRRALSWVEGIE